MKRRQLRGFDLRQIAGVEHLIGVDEAGRGPLAGPVVAAAVILPEAWVLRGIPEAWAGLNDSKQLSESQREHFFDGITRHPEIRFAIASVDAAVIDAINILQATFLAMRRALAALAERPDRVLVDGNKVPPDLGCAGECIVGDSGHAEHGRVDDDVAPDRLVEGDRTWCHRRLHVDVGLEDVVVDDHTLRGVFTLVRVFGEDDGDRFADVAHLAAREQRARHRWIEGGGNLEIGRAHV